VPSVVAHGGADPAVVAAHAGVDAGVTLHGAVVTPGHNSLQLTVTHQRTARVSLQHKQKKMSLEVVTVNQWHVFRRHGEHCTSR